MPAATGCAALVVVIITNWFMAWRTSMPKLPTIAASSLPVADASTADAPALRPHIRPRRPRPCAQTQAAAWLATAMVLRVPCLELACQSTDSFNRFLRPNPVLTVRNSVNVFLDASLQPARLVLVRADDRSEERRCGE